jgi:sterol 14-demethylase
MARREAQGPPPHEERDLVDVLMSLRNDDNSWVFSPDQVTGMFISMMFAGHHTTSTTASWAIIELLRNPDVYARVTEEIDALARRGGGEVTYHDLREVPWLEATIKETLRLHPPLILLLRKAMVDLEVGGYRVDAGKLVGVSPAVSNCLPEAFGNPEEFRPERYVEPDAADLDNPWNWIPFGAGRHRCVGAAFAMMQLKAVFCRLLADWEFAAAQPPETYRNDHSKMVVQLAQPCRVSYRRRSGG